MKVRIFFSALKLNIVLIDLNVTKTTLEHLTFFESNENYGTKYMIDYLNSM